MSAHTHPYLAKQLRPVPSDLRARALSLGTSIHEIAVKLHVNDHSIAELLAPGGRLSVRMIDKIRTQLERIDNSNER